MFQKVAGLGQLGLSLLVLLNQPGYWPEYPVVKRRKKQRSLDKGVK